MPMGNLEIHLHSRACDAAHPKEARQGDDPTTVGIHHITSVYLRKIEVRVHGQRKDIQEQDRLREQLSLRACTRTMALDMVDIGSFFTPSHLADVHPHWAHVLDIRVRN